MAQRSDCHRFDLQGLVLITSLVFEQLGSCRLHEHERERDDIERPCVDISAPAQWGGGGGGKKENTQPSEAAICATCTKPMQGDAADPRSMRVSMQLC